MSISNILTDAITRELADRGLKDSGLSYDALCEIRAMCSDISQDIEHVVQDLMRIVEFAAKAAGRVTKPDNPAE